MVKPWKRDVAVLGDLNVSGARHQHLHGPLGPQVGLENILEAFGSADVEAQGLRRAVDLSLGIQEADGRHFLASGWKLCFSEKYPLAVNDFAGNFSNLLQYSMHPKRRIEHVKKF